MEVRDAESLDVAGITAIYNDAVEHTTAIWNDVTVDEANRSAWLDDRRAADRPVLVAVDDSGVVGYASYGDWRAWDGYRHTVEHSVYVRKDQRGNGIGRALMDELIDRARRAGVHVMVAGVDGSNVGSIRLHEKLGFRDVGTLHQVGTKFGRWLDLTFLELALDVSPVGSVTSEESADLETGAALPAAFFLPVGEDEFDSTVATSSPWDERMQHGGPPAALLARAVERSRPDPDMPIARLTVDMLGPIPQGRIRTEATIVRPGRRVELVEAKLWADGKLAVSATAWRIRRTPESTAQQANSEPAPALPGAQPQRFFPGLDPSWGYGRAIEWRFAEGAYDALGPASVWTRLRIPLVAGEETSPVQRAAVVADSANGISAELPLADWMFVPPSLTITFGREPVGEWVNLAARSHLFEDGTGFTTGHLADGHGLLGSVDQPLLVAQR